MWLRARFNEDVKTVNFGGKRKTEQNVPPYGQAGAQSP